MARLIAPVLNPPNPEIFFTPPVFNSKIPVKDLSGQIIFQTVKKPMLVASVHEKRAKYGSAHAGPFYF
jgi:hypothetical protein